MPGLGLVGSPEDVQSVRASKGEGGEPVRWVPGQGMQQVPWQSLEGLGVDKNRGWLPVSRGQDFSAWSPVGLK